VFPDVEVLLVAYLNGKTGRRVVTELPADLDSELPVIKVACGVGDDDSFRLDRSVVDVDVFAADRSAAASLAGDVRGFLLEELRSELQPAGVVTGVRTVVKPRWVPDPNPNLRRYTATYAVYAHT
jgi:hypothetical protein